MYCSPLIYSMMSSSSSIIIIIYLSSELRPLLPPLNLSMELPSPNPFRGSLSLTDSTQWSMVIGNLFFFQKMTMTSLAVATVLLWWLLWRGMNYCRTFQIESRNDVNMAGLIDLTYLFEKARRFLVCVPP